MFPFQPKPLLSKAIQEQVTACIAAMELKSTGEIRVFVESHCAYVDPLQRCEEVFLMLNMQQTEQRNGVVLYLALKDRQFAIAGDTGINAKVGGNAYWQAAANVLKGYLQQGLVAEGICHCVSSIGDSLAQYFPNDGTHTNNELPDEIVFGK